VMDKIDPAASQAAPVAPAAKSTETKPADDSKSKDIPK
jgi:hypothetical protein